ncbi:MAG: NUDIX hydrolase [Pyrinomonadaceae bacterium]|nr:NUDIX hydrolase [Phycisphaerales bacterium]
MTTTPSPSSNRFRTIFRLRRSQQHCAEVTIGLGILAVSIFVGAGAAGCAVVCPPDKRRYRQLQQEHPSIMQRTDENISILSEERWSEAERAAAARLQKQGYSKQWGLVGVVAEDQYVILLRDPVRFSDGTVGTYIRVLQKPLTHQGAVVPLIIDDKFLLVEHYRHATGRWHWEFVRGWADATDVSVEATAAREASEEVGFEPSQMQFLGFGYPDGGLLGSRVGFVAGRLPANAAPSLDQKEGIRKHRLVDNTEFLRMIREGEIDDDFTLAAYARLVARGLTCSVKE